MLLCCQENVQKMFRKCSLNVWKMFTKCLENVCRMHGKCLQNVWKMFANFLDNDRHRLRLGWWYDYSGTGFQLRYVYIMTVQCWQVVHMRLAFHLHFACILYCFCHHQCYGFTDLIQYMPIRIHISILCSMLLLDLLYEPLWLTKDLILQELIP